MRAVTVGPEVPAVNRTGPTPNEVLIPLGEMVSRTPGIGLKLCRNRHPIAAASPLVQRYSASFRKYNGNCPETNRSQEVLDWAGALRSLPRLTARIE
jgi:hypothetical protein